MVNSGKITAPINAADPYVVLGVNPANGYDIGTICSNSHGKMNKWSIRKPMHVANILRPLTDAEIKAANCGLGVFYSISVDAAVAKVKDGCDWEYYPPRGGIASPYRLTDFNGYDHYTPRWCQLEVTHDGKKEVKLDGMEQGIATIREWVGALSVHFSGTDAYACMLLFRKNSTGGVSSSILYVMGQLNDFDWEKECNISHTKINDAIGKGDTYVIPVVAVLTFQPLDLPYIFYGDSGGTATIYPLPSELVTVKIKDADEQKTYPHEVGVTVEYVSGSVQWTESGGTWVGTGSITLRVRNTGSVSRKVSLQCFYNQNLTDDTLQVITSGGSVDKNIDAGGFLELKFKFSQTSLTEPKESNIANVFYKLESSGCDGYDTGQFTTGVDY
ncbi:MAG: hypothetical protein K2M07_06840 [Muribaculaceae bacterium]|nr:hypothetical protein [Muribaculaceae bacterium]